jgi:hypothetical protein
VGHICQALGRPCNGLSKLLYRTPFTSLGWQSAWGGFATCAASNSPRSGLSALILACNAVLDDEDLRSFRVRGKLSPTTTYDMVQPSTKRHFFECASSTSCSRVECQAGCRVASKPPDFFTRGAFDMFLVRYYVHQAALATGGRQGNGVLHKVQSTRQQSPSTGPPACGWEDGKRAEN